MKRDEERRREKKREEERTIENNREQERNREKRRELEREKMSRVNYYKSAFNSQKEKLNILADILEISKSGCCRCRSIYYNRPPSL